ncbi:MAG: phosphoribosylamine--glycine ligase, partial [Fidelibacterota bacterium]
VPVVKVDGLAAGKGSIVCFTREEALRAVKMIMIDRKFGSAGRKIVVEEYLEGEEASLLAISDGESFLTLPSSQDHKPIYDDDRGPNTGGMGAYAPAPLIDDHLLKHIEETIIAPTIRGMREEDNPFKGVLYAGLMITSDGPKVVEFNCRFGDPEAQAVLPLVDLDLMDILISSVDEQISSIRLNPPHSSSVCVVLASQGYPGSYEKGKVITGLDKVRDPDIVVFHAGTAVVEGKLVTNGGRVLGVTAVKSSLKEAVKAVYRAADKISFEGKYFRRDIGRKGLKRLEQN